MRHSLFTWTFLGKLFWIKMQAIFQGPWENGFFATALWTERKASISQLYLGHAIGDLKKKKDT